ncbi:hypothetical protein ABH931_006124 [Streptacidiphilus sp. MAP12-33]|uniref:hypothetical protein n=1 Tax=Streptacidiphilus sp. MAP12-33 TaxID=3156266 RepID=UPI00351897D8
MTALLPERISTTPAMTLARRVAAHMEAHYPDTTDAAAWTVAEDHRDGSAVVVWRIGNDRAFPAGARGTVLYRWLLSLRDAGFAAEARTDMEVFGRPDEEAPGGRALWLHVTDWHPTALEAVDS